MIIRLFEDYLVDNILDKISKYGVESITDVEKNYLYKFSKNKHLNLKNTIEIKEDEYRKILNNDPSKDEFYSDIDLNWSEEEKEDIKYQILWNIFDKNYKLDFLRINNISSDANLDWLYIDNKTKDKFKKYCQKFK